MNHCWRRLKKTLIIWITVICVRIPCLVSAENAGSPQVSSAKRAFAGSAGIFKALEPVIIVAAAALILLKIRKSRIEKAKKAEAARSFQDKVSASHAVNKGLLNTAAVSPDRQLQAPVSEPDDPIRGAVKRILENTEQTTSSRPSFRHENPSVLDSEKAHYNYIELKSATPADHSWDIVKMGFDKETKEVIYRYGRQISRGFFLDGEWETEKKDFAQLRKDTGLEITADNCDDFVPEDRKSPWSQHEHESLEKETKEIAADESFCDKEPDILAYYSFTTRRFGASVHYIRRTRDGYRAFCSRNARTGVSSIMLPPLPSEEEIDHYMDHSYYFDSYDRLLTEKEVRFFHWQYHDSKRNDNTVQNDLYGSGRTTVYTVKSSGSWTQDETEPTVRSLRLDSCIDDLARGVIRFREEMPQADPVIGKAAFPPIRLENNQVLISSDALQKWLFSATNHPPFRCEGFLPLQERTPAIEILEDGKLTRRFILETEAEEDLSGKYLQFTALAYRQGEPKVTVIQMDGLVTDNADARKQTMSLKDIAYRFEIYFLRKDPCSGVRYAELEGQGLENKALKLNGLMTPVNVRSVAWCSRCHHSFAFRTYNFPAMQAIPIYSDDGQEVYEGSVYELQDLTAKEKEEWAREINGVVFRYRNTLRCPRCGHPYFDYSLHPRLHRVGELGCVLTGKKVIPYQSDPS